MRFGIVFVGVLTLFLMAGAVTIKRECPAGEVHKSCVFQEEYTCWEDETKMTRVKMPPKRLLHCRAGCFCKKGYVRAYPHGPCIVAYKCNNRALHDMLNKIPALQKK